VAVCAWAARTAKQNETSPNDRETIRGSFTDEKIDNFDLLIENAFHNQKLDMTCHKCVARETMRQQWGDRTAVRKDTNAVAAHKL